MILKDKINSIVEGIATSRASDIVKKIQPLLQSDGKILDFGSGVGYIGYLISQMTGHDIIYLDVKQYPFTHPKAKPLLYNGTSIPLNDKSCDTALIMFVLHHTKYPIEALKEVIRVTNSRIIICEDMLISKRDVPIEIVKDIISNYFFTHITFSYKTEAEWEAIFDTLQLRINKKIHFETNPLFFSMKHIAWQLQI